MRSKSIRIWIQEAKSIRICIDLDPKLCKKHNKFDGAVQTTGTCCRARRTGTSGCPAPSTSSSSTGMTSTGRRCTSGKVLSEAAEKKEKHFGSNFAVYFVSNNLHFNSGTSTNCMVSIWRWTITRKQPSPCCFMPIC